MRTCTGRAVRAPGGAPTRRRVLAMVAVGGAGAQPSRRPVTLRDAAREAKLAVEY
jgi:hypothetical protein